MIDVRKVRMLAALDRLGTIAAVADELRLTAPGVSMQLGALERQLGVTLTERQGRRLALTPAGKLLASRGRDLLDRISLVELEVDALRGGTAGTYRVAAFPSAAQTLVAEAWRRLRAEGSGIELTLTTPEPEDALAALAAGITDLAIVHSYSNVPRDLPDGIEADPIASEPIWVAIHADDPCAAPSIDIAELAHHPWITPHRGLSCFDMTNRACALAGFRPRIVVDSMDFAAQLQLVAAGVGVALLPDLTVAAVPRGVMLARPTSPLHRDSRAARRSTLRGDAVLDRLVRLLREAAGDRIRDMPPRSE